MTRLAKYQCATAHSENMGSASFEQSFADHGWSVAQGITAVGEVVLLPLVVLVSFLPQPELFAAMSEDTLIPVTRSDPLPIYHLTNIKSNP